MTREEQVSVIVPLYNHQHYIGRCIRSLINQSFARARYEIIVIDDGSQDDSVAALSPYLDDIILLRNRRNQGLPAALNKAIKASRGQYVVRVDSDDFVHVDYLKVLHLFLTLNHSFDAVACDYLVVDERQNVVSRSNCSENPIGCGIMFRRDHLIEIGLYNPDFLRHEDRELRLRFEQNYKVTRIDVPLYKYMMHDTNITKDKGLMERYEKKLPSIGR